MLEDYRAATERATIHGIPPLPAKWEPPSDGFFKVNFDDAWTDNQNSIGIWCGYFAINEVNFMQASVKRGTGQYRQKWRNLYMAAREAIGFAIDVGFRDSS